MEQLIFSELSEKTMLYEQTDYGILFDDIQVIPECADGYKGILRMVSPNTGVLNFGNCIGWLDFFGRTVSVQSKKISQECYESMLVDICGKMAELPFNFNSPTFEPVEIDTSGSASILYHSFLILRFIILNADTNLEGAYEGVFKNPSRKIEREVYECNTWEATNFGVDTIHSIVTRPDRLYTLNETNRLCKTHLSQCLSQGKASSSFPEKVNGIKPSSSLDTPENRFVKYFLEFCSGMLHAFKQRLAGFKLLNGSFLVCDIRRMLEVIEVLQIHSFFHEIGEMRCVPFNSTVLQKRSGYKEILCFYNLLQSSIRIPFFEEKTRLVIENKDIAELYEIWTYFRLVELVEELFGVPPSKADILTEDEFKAFLQQSVFVEFYKSNHRVRVWYNKTFGRKRGSYSLALRPDIVIETPMGKYIFDAKFKLECINWDNIEEEKGFTFKNGDIYKMHTYKDAIEGVKIACILYPNKDTGRDKVFWESELDSTGVGAFSLLPDVEPTGLKNMLKEIITKIYN
jgi:predicted component of viral defense system (DUF524 family)